MISQARRAVDLVRGYAKIAEVFHSFVIASVVLPFDAAAVAAFQGISPQLRLATMDRRIAAVALSRSLILLTRNTRDFSKVPGLTTQDWTT